MTTPDWLTETPIAHRGLHHHPSGVPENSLPAFERAIAAGRPIELDVHLLRDGGLAVFHDSTLTRMTGRDGAIAECRSHDVTAMRLMGASQTIPLLAQVLALVGGRVPLLIEIKNPSRRAGASEGALAAHLGGYDGPVAVQSFNPYALRRFRAAAPHIPRGQLAGGFPGEAMSATRRSLLRNLALNRLSAPAFIGYDVRFLPHWRVAQCRRQGITILGWTVTSEQEERRALAFCDNVIFEGYTPADRE